MERAMSDIDILERANAGEFLALVGELRQREIRERRAAEHRYELFGEE